ncbi:hypothetical protein [Clostridium paridis]|uniref:DUF3139 domain-containing protein n=1 Tax=Clostridium paridis TaxID=2803863 RepID=A0A937FJY6_9CLOT|nr:hypothetical protein [Clostridium paridis]MBL4933271.1 hypothetical protein [Clostridium paridis]
MRKKLIILVISIIMIFTIVMHLNPYYALRLHLFVTGYRKAALESRIIESSHDSNQDNVKYYYFDKRPIDMFGSEQGDYKVTKIGPLYFVKYQGI